MPIRKNRRAKGEGSIRYIESKGLYEARFVIGVNPETGKPITKSIYDKLQKNVVAKMRDVLQSLGKGEYVDPSSKTLIGWIREWYELYKEPNMKTNTKEKTLTSIKRIENSKIANMRLKELNHEILQKYYNKLKNEYSTETIKATHTVINGALEKADEIKMIVKNPARFVIVPKGTDKDDEKDAKALTEEEYKDFMNEMRNRSNYYAFAVFMGSTGLRPGEAIALTRSDLDFNKKTVRVNKTFVRAIKGVQNSTKTTSSKRVVPVPDSLLSLMREYMMRQPNQRPESPLFQTLNGTMLSPRNALRAFEEIATNKSYSWLNLHTLRHTYASRLFKDGVDVKIISKLLGHAKVSTTYDIYVHFINNAVEEAVQLLNDENTNLPEKKVPIKRAKAKVLKRPS